MALPKPKLSKNALVVLKERCLRKDPQGKIIETPQQLFLRVARHIAEVETRFNPKASKSKWQNKFYNLMARLEFLPNSPTLMNIGTPMEQLAACFVLPVEDSMESIFEAVKNSAIIHKTGGGTGFTFSHLRPKNDLVKTTHGTSSGPVSFMRVFDAATTAVKQGGVRRGANMGILRVDHPDILEFIEAKKEEHELINFNISVGLTDKFMKALTEKKYYPLINPRTGKKTSELNAQKVFRKIVRMAWRNGEPGVLFLDRIENQNPTPVIGSLESTNPCGEQPLLPFESCTLGSINVSKFAKNSHLDWNRLRGAVATAVRFLDNVIEANKYPFDEVERMTKANRKIGLGVMGFADLLICLKIPYDSNEAVELGSDLMKFIQEESKNESKKLGSERGVFPNIQNSIYKNQLLRNATTTTVAPTGTLSAIANCSSGIEPLFAISYVKNVLNGKKLLEINPMFKKAARSGGFDKKKILEKIALSGSIQNISEIPLSVRRQFKTMRDIAPEWHVRIQAAFQRHTDNAVSKTVNFPQRATPKDFEKVFKLAYQLGCKGITAYREKSRLRQVLSLPDSNGI